MHTNHSLTTIQSIKHIIINKTAKAHQLQNIQKY